MGIKIGHQFLSYVYQIIAYRVASGHERHWWWSPVPEVPGELVVDGEAVAGGGEGRLLHRPQVPHVRHPHCHNIERRSAEENIKCFYDTVNLSAPDNALEFSLW